MVAGGDDSAMAKLQGGGRVLVERMALLLQAAVLLDHAPAEVAESFVLARLGEDRGREYGALPDGVAVDLLVERAGLREGILVPWQTTGKTARRHA